MVKLTVWYRPPFYTDAENTIEKGSRIEERIQNGAGASQIKSGITMKTVCALFLKKLFFGAAQSD